MRFFGGALDRGRIQSSAGATAIYSGLDYGVFNIGMLDGRSCSGIEDFEARLASCARFFIPRTSRWSFWLCEDLVDRAALREIRGLMQDRDFRLISQAPGMVAPLLAPPVRPIPLIECHPVNDRATREAFARITSESFDIPNSVAKAVYEPERAWLGDYRGFVGSAAGKIIATVAVVAAGDALGIYSLATVAEYRRRGYGEALLRSAIAAERERTGLNTVILQSTEAGYSMYKRIGFREVTKFSVYLTK